jgi:hypothetical protein
LSTTLDTQALAQTLPQLTLDYTTPFQAGGPRTFDLAEGDHTLSSYYGWGGSVNFHVDGSGSVTYDPSLNGVLSGAGTAASPLVVHGRTITVDARALRLSLPLVDLDHQVDFAGAAPLTATVLPGRQVVVSAYGYGGSADFSVGNDGTVDYGRLLDLSGTLSGRGTSVLVVHGDTVQIDARALSPSTPSFTLAGIGTYPTATVLGLTLLPGWERFSTPNETFDFHVDEFSRIDYDPINDGLAGGRDTSTLVLLAPPPGPGGAASSGEEGTPSRAGAVAEGPGGAPAGRPAAELPPAGGGAGVAAADQAPAVRHPVDALLARGRFGPRRVPSFAARADQVIDEWDLGANS